MEPEIQAQFGRIHDVTRNIFLDQITAYFQTPSVVKRLKEIPTIEKYEINQHSPDNFITAENIVMYFPDLFERLPLIAVSSVGGRRREIVGFPTLTQQYHYTLLSSTKDAPYSLTVMDDLQLRVGDKTYDVVFMENAFANFDNVSIAEISAYFQQVISFVMVQDLAGKLGMIDFYSRDIFVEGGTAVDKLGFTMGQGPDTSKFFEYLFLGEDLGVIIDVMTSDRNQRVEIMDILSSLLGMYVYDENIGQWFTPLAQVIFQGQYTRRGETEIVQEGAPYSKVYADSVEVPVATYTYLQRVKVDASVQKILGGDP